MTTTEEAAALVNVLREADLNRAANAIEALTTERDRLLASQERAIAEAVAKRDATIAALRAEVAGLRDALQDAVHLLEKHYPNPAPNGQINRARAALAPKRVREGDEQQEDV